MKHSFLGNTLTTLVQQFAKIDFNEMVEDVNEKVSVGRRGVRVEREYADDRFDDGISRLQHMEGESPLQNEERMPGESCSYNFLLPYHSLV